MFAVVYVPNFFLQAALRHEPQLRDSVVALVDDETPRSPVWQVTDGGRRFGIAPGITSTQAKARCTSIVFRLRSAEQEEAAQEILLECAYLSAAYIESTAPGICTLDLRGLSIQHAQPLEPALRTWADQLRGRIAQFHLEAHVGVAAAPALALQAAQGANEFCYVDEPRKFWKTLPVESLAPAPELLKVLRKWGVRTVQEFLALGKAPIAERLGAAGVQLYAQAKADVVRPLRLTSPKQIFEESHAFEELVETLEPLLFVVRRLLDQVARRVEQASLTVAEIGLTLRLESGSSHAADLRVAAPTREVSVLFRIVHNYLETVRTRSAVVGLGIRVKPCEVVTQQFQLFDKSLRDPNRFFETVGRLSALLGADRVGTPQMRNSYRPDDFEMVAPTPAGVGVSHETRQSLFAEKHRRKFSLALRRYRPPLPATVRAKKGVPIYFESAGSSGAIEHSRGPWRVSGNWWEKQWAREEWDVQTREGGLYRLFWENDGWFVEGAYD